MSNTTEVYPRAPLVEVVFEIRFPGEPALECHRDELYEFVRAKMPVVRVPEPAAPENFKFRTYQYSSEDGAFTVMSGLNNLAYSSKKYTHFNDFKTQLTPIFRFVVERFKLKSLRRFGFRYINAIPFSREGGTIPIGSYFRSKFSLSPDMPDAVEQCAITLVQKMGSGQVITRLEGLQQQVTNEEAILLDIDYFRDRDLKASAFPEYLEEAHTGAKHYFESIIGEQYREFLKGKPLV